MSSNPQPRFRPEPVETTSRSNRRFAPQPVEITTRSSRKPTTDAEHMPTKRRFLPQPIETTIRSSRESQDEQDMKSRTKSESGFAPQLLETTTRSSKDGPCIESHVTVEPNIEEVDRAVEACNPTVAAPQPRRKFVPELLETAARQRRAPEIKRSRHHNTNTTNRQKAPCLLALPPPGPPVNTPTAFLTPALSTRDRRRLGIPLPPRQSSIDSFIGRTHSFRVPDLEPIESSESEEELDDQSRDLTPSSSSDISDRSYNHATRRRESVDKGSSGYLLELAAKAAERQIREQGLAAFPNDDRHTYVDHFIGRMSEASTAAPSRTASEVNFRRDSGFFRTDLQYREMQRHQQKLADQREREKQEKARRQRRLNGQISGDRNNNNNNGSKTSPWKSPYARTSTTGPDIFGNRQKDNELERMRNRARPPMLGKDLVFPRCPSPSPARFDVTQGSHVVRSSMCYLTEQSQTNNNSSSNSGSQDKACGLWAGGTPKKTSPPSVQGTMWSVASTTPRSNSPSTGGLWGGFCTETTALPPTLQTGLLTPRAEEGNENPFNRAVAAPSLRYNRSSPAMMLHQLPPSPPPSNADLAGPDDKPELEQAIEDEFDDAFITQVYNYLSLGYPSLARRFDAELGKIAKVPVADLRQDDYISTSRGYIRLGDDDIAREQGIAEENCARWKALRVYVHEWARQQPFMGQAVGQPLQTAARRGSWAW